jgi:hypothetical protein
LIAGVAELMPQLGSFRHAAQAEMAARFDLADGIVRLAPQRPRSCGRLACVGGRMAPPVARRLLATAMINRSGTKAAAPPPNACKTGGNAR